MVSLINRSRLNHWLSNVHRKKEMIGEGYYRGFKWKVIMVKIRLNPKTGIYTLFIGFQLINLSGISTGHVLQADNSVKELLPSGYMINTIIKGYIDGIKGN